MQRDPRQTRVRLSNAFLDGFTQGLSAPASVFLNLREPRVFKVSSLKDIWNDVGQFISASAREYQSSRAKHRD
jgi:hypothetical protein